MCVFVRVLSLSSRQHKEEEILRLLRQAFHSGSGIFTGARAAGVVHLARRYAVFIHTDHIQNKQECAHLIVFIWKLHAMFRFVPIFFLMAIDLSFFDVDNIRILNCIVDQNYFIAAV